MDAFTHLQYCMVSFSNYDIIFMASPVYTVIETVMKAKTPCCSHKLMKTINLLTGKRKLDALWKVYDYLRLSICHTCKEYESTHTKSDIFAKPFRMLSEQRTHISLFTLIPVLVILMSKLTFPITFSFYVTLFATLCSIVS